MTRIEQLSHLWVYLEEWKKGKIGGNILNVLKGYQMLSEVNEDFWRVAAEAEKRYQKILDNEDFWRITAVILTCGVEDLNSKKKIKKYNFDNPDGVVRIFKKIIKK